MNIKKVTISKLHEMTGKDRRTIKKRLINLTPAEIKGRYTYYYISEALELIYSEPEESEDLDLTLERAKLTREQRLKTSLERKQLEGNLLDVQAVVIAFQKTTTAVRSKLLAIPTKMAQELINIKTPVEIQEILKKQIYELLNELSSKQFSEQIGHNIELTLNKIEALD